MSADAKDLDVAMFQTLRAVKFLLFFDAKVGASEERATALYKEFNRDHPLPRHIPFICRDSIIGTHTSIFAWASEKSDEDWAKVGFALKESYKIVYTPRNNGEATVKNVIRVIRNAMAHHAEFSHRQLAPMPPAISWSKKYLSFNSERAGFVRFETEDGFFNFLPDFMRAVDKLLHDDMEKRYPKPT